MPARARLSSSSSMTPRATSRPPKGSPVTRCSARAESTSDGVRNPWETSQSPRRARRDESSWSELDRRRLVGDCFCRGTGDVPFRNDW